MSDYIIKTKLKNNGSYDNISYKCRNINNKKMSDVYNSTTNTMLRANYNWVIRSQEEFETFINRIDLSYGSVLFVGDGGNLEFTLDTGNLIFSNRTFEVAGINNAKIKLNNANYLSRNNGLIGSFKLNGITLTGGNFQNINCLENCHTFNANGFNNCFNLTNCSISGLNSSVSENYFYQCNKLINCIVDFSNTYSDILINKVLYGFNNCNYLINCSFKFYDTSIGNANIQDSNIYGYYFCNYVSNCGSTIRCSVNNQETNPNYISSFNTCKYLNTCKSFYSICDSTNNSVGYGYNLCDHGSACSAENYTTSASNSCTKWDTNSCD